MGRGASGGEDLLLAVALGEADEEGDGGEGREEDEPEAEVVDGVEVLLLHRVPVSSKSGGRGERKGHVAKLREPHGQGSGGTAARHHARHSGVAGALDVVDDQVGWQQRRDRHGHLEDQIAPVRPVGKQLAHRGHHGQWRPPLRGWWSLGDVAQEEEEATSEERGVEDGLHLDLPQDVGGEHERDEEADARLQQVARELEGCADTGRDSVRGAPGALICSCPRSGPTLGSPVFTPKRRARSW